MLDRLVLSQLEGLVLWFYIYERKQGLGDAFWFLHFKVEAILRHIFNVHLNRPTFCRYGRS